MFRGLRRKVAELSRSDCPRFKARGVNGSSSHAVCDAVAMLNNLSIVICTLSIFPANWSLSAYHQGVSLGLHSARSAVFTTVRSNGSSPRALARFSLGRRPLKSICPLLANGEPKPEPAPAGDST